MGASKTSNLVLGRAHCLLLRFGIEYIVLDFSEEKGSQRFKMWPICLLGCPRSPWRFRVEQIVLI